MERIFLDTVEKFDDYIDSGLELGDCIGIDTEADSMYSYSEKLCLVQISFSDGRMCIFDPFVIDKERVMGFLRNKSFILHSADYDLTLLKKSYGFLPHEVYDTQIAARLVGERKFSLMNLLEKYLGENFSKDNQLKDWSRRPLSEEMLDYAYNDVKYLFKLREVFDMKLGELGRLDWHRESCMDLVFRIGEREVNGKKEIWDLNGRGRLNRYGFYFLKLICEWRDICARKRDVPQYKVLHNKRVLSLARFLQNKKNLNRLKNINSDLKVYFLENFDEDAVKIFWNEHSIKKSRERVNFDRRKLNGLLEKRDKIGDDLGIDSSLIASRGALEGYCSGKARDEVFMKWQISLLFD